MKRIFDFLLALVGITLSFPLWVFIGFLVWFDDGFPVFYNQDRLGKDGKIIRILKFRSMRYAAERDLGPVQAKEDDARITKTGRVLRVTALDELPQLWNILKGDMSFVGPRALRLIEAGVEDKEAKGIWEFEGFTGRMKARPGLTGVAQILAPRDIARSQRFRYDNWYIKNHSFWLDIRLIAISFLITFMGGWEKREEKLSKRILGDLAKTI